MALFSENDHSIPSSTELSVTAVPDGKTWCKHGLRILRLWPWIAEVFQPHRLPDNDVIPPNTTIILQPHPFHQTHPPLAAMYPLVLSESAWDNFTWSPVTVWMSKYEHLIIWYNKYTFINSNFVGLLSCLSFNTLF